jgi:hypothetical protein
MKYAPDLWIMARLCSWLVENDWNMLLACGIRLKNAPGLWNMAGVCFLLVEYAWNMLLAFGS